MDVIGLIASVLSALIAGWNVLFWIVRRDRSFPAPEKLALSYIIGLGILTLQMFFYSLSGIRFTVLNVFLPHIALAALNGFVFVNTPRTGDGPETGRWGIFETAVFSGILFQLAHAFFKALIKPMDSFDSIGNFAYKAKLFFTHRQIPYELFLNKNIDIQHADYPHFIPLSETWVYMFLGRCNDIAVKALFPMFFAALLVIFYYCLKRLAGKRISLIATFFLATIPHLHHYATIGYADFVLAMFYSAGFMYLFLWMSHRKDNRYLALAACLSLLAMWTKNEGAMLSLTTIAILPVFLISSGKNLKRRELRGAFCLALILIAAGILWFGFLRGLGLSHETVNRETLKLSVALKNLRRIPLIFYEYQKHIFGPKKWNISLLVFTIGLILYFKKAFKGNFKYITLSILLPLAGYTAVYLITPLEIRYHLQTSGSRLLLHFLPLTVFWIGYLAKEITDGEGNIHR